MTRGILRIDFLRTSSRKLRWVLGTTVACGMVAAGLLVYWVVPGESSNKREVDEKSSNEEHAGLEQVGLPEDEPERIEREVAFEAVERTEPEVEVETADHPVGELEFESALHPEPTEPLVVAENLEIGIDLEKQIDSGPPAGLEPDTAPELAAKESPPTLVASEAVEAPPDEALAEPEKTGDEPETPDPVSAYTAEPKPAPANPRAKEAFLKLWQRIPQFDNQLVALIANWQSGPSPYERRRGVERLKAEQNAVCVSSEKRWETVIKNLSVGGAELLHPEPVPRNTRLALVPSTYEQTVTGRVAWVRENGAGFRIGLNFDLDPETLSESWVAETLLGLGSEFLVRRAPRRYVRVATEVHSRLVTEDGRHIEVVLCDVSLGGCLLQSAEPFQVEELTLRLGSVDCLGKVVNNRKRPDEGWSHHVTFAPMGPLETLRLLRTISSLLKNR